LLETRLKNVFDNYHSVQYFDEVFEKEQCNRTCDTCEANHSYDVLDVTTDAKTIVALGKRK
jgi:hypothetical protein